MGDKSMKIVILIKYGPSEPMELTCTCSPLHREKKKKKEPPKLNQGAK